MLVTGGSGALGRHVVEHLIRADHEVAIVRHPGDQAGAAWAGAHGIRTYDADVRNPEAVSNAVRGQHAVVHLAAVPGIRRSDRDAMQDVNVGGTRAVAQACWRTGARLVHMSSASAVGLSPRAEPIEEDFPFWSMPIRHAYPTSKRRAQDVVVDYIREGLDGVILNPGAVLAPGDPRGHAWSALPRLIGEGLRVAPPGGFGFVGRASLLEAIERALEAPASPEPTLVVDQCTTYQSVFALVARALGRSGPVRVPPRVTAGLLRVAGLSAGLPLGARGADTDASLLPLIAWPNNYGGARSRTRLRLTQRPLRDAVADLVTPIPNGA